MAKDTRAPNGDEFSRYLDEYPATLELWRAGEEGLYRLLAALNVYPVAVQRDEAHRIGPHLTTMRYHSAHHNQVGIVIAWALTHMRGRVKDADPPIEELELTRPAGRSAFAKVDTTGRMRRRPRADARQSRAGRSGSCACPGSAS